MMASHVILKSFTIGLLRSTVAKAGTSVQSAACYPNLLCKAGMSRFRSPPRASDPRKAKPPTMEGDMEQKSDWMKLNDTIFPPLLPNEEPRPAVCKGRQRILI